MSSQILVDWILASCTFVLFLAYHLYLFIRVRYWPLSTVIGVNHLTRRCWVEDIMLRNNGKDGILAVQSLRNGIMASSLLASTSILLASTLAGFAASSDKWTGLDVIVVSFGSASVTAAALLANNVTSPNPVGVPGTLDQDRIKLIAIKFLVLITTFLASFFCYSQSIRLYNHVTFLINIPLDKFHSIPKASLPSTSTDITNPNPIDSPLVISYSSPQKYINYVNLSLERAANFYTIGTRLYYLAMIVLLWLLGSVFMIVAVVLFTVLLVFLDRASFEDHQTAIAGVMPGVSSENI